MRLFISGGCKNGKSSIAEAWLDQTANRDRPLYYLATMLPKDEEDHARILTHQLNRQAIPFTTIEIARDIHRVLDTCDPDGFFLLDSTTALLENEMFLDGGAVHSDAGEKIAGDLTELLNNIENIVIVSDFLFSDAFFYDSLTEHFRRSLAWIDRQIAAHCDVVIEVCLGQPIIHKGKHLLQNNPELVNALHLKEFRDAMD